MKVQRGLWRTPWGQMGRKFSDAIPRSCRWTEHLGSWGVSLIFERSSWLPKESARADQAEETWSQEMGTGNKPQIRA